MGLATGKGKLIFAVDFDGTITTHAYPEIGKPLYGAIETMKELNELGHKIILYTMRGIDMKTNRNTLQEAVDYLTKNGVELYGVNENRQQKHWTNSAKIYAHSYIDDAALGVPLQKELDENDRAMVDWIKVRKLLGLKALVD